MFWLKHNLMPNRTQIPALHRIVTMWASTWQNQQSDCVPSEDSDQPGYLPSLISLCCALNGLLSTQAFFMQTVKTRIRPADAQADLSSLGAVTLLVLSWHSSNDLPWIRSATHCVGMKELWVLDIPLSAQTDQPAWMGRLICLHYTQIILKDSLCPSHVFSGED